MLKMVQERPIRCHFFQACSHLVLIQGVRPRSSVFGLSKWLQTVTLIRASSNLFKKRRQLILMLKSLSRCYLVDVLALSRSICGVFLARINVTTLCKTLIALSQSSVLQVMSHFPFKVTSDPNLKVKWILLLKDAHLRVCRSGFTSMRCLCRHSMQAALSFYTECKWYAASPIGVLRSYEKSQLRMLTKEMLSYYIKNVGSWFLDLFQRWMWSILLFRKSTFLLDYLCEVILQNC